MTVDEMGARMSSREVGKWLAIFALEHDEMEAARKGLPHPAPSSEMPSADEVQRRLEVAFPVTE